MKVNHEINIWKFIFAVTIVLLHSFSMFGNQFIYMPGGSIGVDFFFLVTGYFMIQSVNKKTYVQLGGLLSGTNLKKLHLISIYPVQ